jgi:hypothetical protein
VERAGLDIEPTNGLTRSTGSVLVAALADRDAANMTSENNDLKFMWCKF